ncbi:unnamed protein product [Caenorhabditis brenneri]
MFEVFPQSARISQFLTIFFFHAQSLSTITICAHRLSSAKYVQANKYWNRYYFLIYLGIVVFSFSMTYLLSFQQIYFDYDKNMFQMEDATAEQHRFYIIYLFCIFSIYFITIMIFGVFTLRQVREQLGDHADQHAQLIKRLSWLAVAHTALFSLYLFWLISSSIVPFYLAIEALTVATDVVAFSMTYMLLIFDTNVRKVLEQIVLVRLSRGSVNDVQSSGPVAS